MSRPAMAESSSHHFYAHARDEGRSRAHIVPGAISLQDAALRFVEHWDDAAAAQVRVIVTDADTGEERCFCIDLDAGEAAPCG